MAVEYAAGPDARPLHARVAAALARLLARPVEDRGDVLVFLPGAAEIRRAAAAIEPLAAEHNLAVVALHGDLPLDAQQRAIRRGAQRKLVLSTNVAETALTIEGVTTVIDSGLAREARFDAKHGINALRVVPISRAAADQRAGRAGRTAPGRCVRLWAAHDHSARRAHETPEVLRLDLCATMLELRAWGGRDLRWLDAPPAAALQRAERVLRLLGAIDDASGTVTPIGRQMLELSVEPRLARLLVEAERRACAEAGALLAALASERDICIEQRALGGGVHSRRPAGPSDLLLRAQLFEEAERRGLHREACAALDLEWRTVRAVERARRHLLRAMRRSLARGADVDVEPLLRCTLAGFPDRVVRRRAPDSPRGLMVGGKGVVLADSSVVRAAELFVAVEVDAGPHGALTEARVRIASAVERVWLDELIPGSVRHERTLVFDTEGERVVERTREYFQDLVLSESVRTDVEARHAGDVLAEAARRDPVTAAGVAEPVQAFLQRVRFLRSWMPDLAWPADTVTLLADAVVSLCAGRRSFAELRRGDLLGALRGLLTRRQLAALEQHAPAQYRLPSGRLAAVTYADGKPPFTAARIQELFGLTATPRLAGGRVALVLHLLAPNQRPVQITDDLESFWRRTYPEVRKLLRGRYPKHDWPEDPLTASPTSPVRRHR